MPSLVDTQRQVRRALVSGDTAVVEPMLIGGQYPARRMAIHHRHYQASLVAALIARFPASVWLMGAAWFAQAAACFVREHPPTVMCIAEYGDAVPAFLGSCPGAGRAPYLTSFAQLEWHVGQVAVAVDQPSLTLDEISRVDGDLLSDATLALQPGLRYVDASWPVHELMTLFLTQTAPDHLALDPQDVWLEVRGARGAFEITRLDAGDYAFRSAVQAGQSIGAAASAVLARDPNFDPGRGLASVVAGGLALRITSQLEGAVR
jgi:hypothetical protein